LSGLRGKPTLRTYEMISFHFIDWAGEDGLMLHIEKLRIQDEATAAKR
jgi:hypothetical protein